MSISGMTYDAIAHSIHDYYGAGSSVWMNMQLGNLSQDEISFYLSRIPRMQVDTAKNGTFLGFSYAEPVNIQVAGSDDLWNTFDSNVNPGQYSGYTSFKGNIPGNFSNNGGNITVTPGSAGAGGISLNTISDRLSLAVVGVNVGAKLGKAIDETLYNLNPDWWDEHLPTINPDTWAGIAGQNEFGQSFIRGLFDIKTDNPTAYVDENVIAQIYQLLRDNGVINRGDQIVTDNTIPDSTITIEGEIKYNTPPYHHTVSTWQVTNYNSYKDSIVQTENNIPVQMTHIIDGWNYYIVCTNTNPINFYTAERFYDSQQPANIYRHTPSTFTIDGKTVYYSYWKEGGDPDTNLTIPTCNISNADRYIKEIAWLMQYGEHSSIGGIDGMSDIEGATQYPPASITGTDLATVLRQLKTTYPDLFNDSITETTINPDGSTTSRTYVPIPWITTSPDTNTTPQNQRNPITSSVENPQTHTNIDPDTAVQIIAQPDSAADSQTDTGTPTSTTNPPNTGDGDAPISAMPIGHASSLWAVYNPSQSQLDSFGAWLWSSDFIEQIKKLFADPMQAIIGIHKVFATPITGGSRNIICGYIDSGVSAPIVTNQYTTIDCGTISLFEYFGNVMDYAPYTRVKIYLPFIGIVPLDVADIMRSYISVKYKVDVFTGACLAQVEINRDNAGGTLYTYSGSCIVSYPLSSGSYAGIISGVLSAVSGLAVSALTGGNPIPAIAGAGSAIMNSHTDVSTHGTFTGCAGAMGIKVPYLIITRPQTITPYRANKFIGYSAPHVTELQVCKGFIKCRDAHINLTNAYAIENDEINDLLMSGVIMESTFNGGNVPIKSSVIPLSVTENGTYNASGDVTGYNPVYVNIPIPTFITQEKTVTTNGIVLPDNGYDGLSQVTVNVPAGGVALPNILIGGYYGSGAMSDSTSINIDTSNYIGKYGLIIVHHRDTLTVPSTFTLIDYIDVSYDSYDTISQYVSIYKIQISANSYTINQNSNVRMGVEIWIFDNDFSLTAINTMRYDTTNTNISITNNNIELLIFSSISAPTDTSAYTYVESNGIWLNCPIILEQQLRHFSGIIYGNKTYNFNLKVSSSPINTRGTIKLYSVGGNT